MTWTWFFTLLLAAMALADYNIDNANTSVVYSCIPSMSGKAWETFSSTTQEIQVSNGSSNITLDSSHCYDQNYALCQCGTSDGCYIEISFAGSGITIYIFNAGFTGAAAKFSVDGGTPVSNTIQPPPSPPYQVSNVSMYDIQGLPSGNHTMTVTVLDWNDGGSSMMFDYAHVNESFVTLPTPTPALASIISGSLPIPTLSFPSVISTSASSQSQTPPSNGNASTSNKVDFGGIIGGALGGCAFLLAVMTTLCYMRKRRTAPLQEQVDPFVAQHSSNSSGPADTRVVSQFQTPKRTLFVGQHAEMNIPVQPLQRSAILREAFAASSSYPSPEPFQTSLAQSVESGTSLSDVAILLLSRPQSLCSEGDMDGAEPPSRSNTSPRTDAGSPFADSQVALSSRDSRSSLTAVQRDMISRLRAANVATDEEMMRVIEFMSSPQYLAGEMSGSRVRHDGSASVLGVPPPSYQTNDS